MSTTTATLFGFHAVLTALKTHPRTVKKLWLLNERADDRMQAVTELAVTHRIPVQRLSRAELEKRVSSDKVHQGILADCEPMLPWSEGEFLDVIDSFEKPHLFLVLDGVQDPHNVGACLRSANAFGVQAVIVPKDRASGLTAAARKVACGADLVTPFVVVTNISRTIDKMKELGIWIIGTHLNTPTSLSDMNFKDSVALVMGGEENGMRRLTAERCDFLAKIPMAGSVQSLNVSVSTGICLYEVFRQRTTIFPK